MIETLKSTLVIVDQVVTRAVELFGADSGKYGGYFTVTFPNGIPILTSRHGEMNDEKYRKYLLLSQEKCLRLAMYPGHLTSFESRNPDGLVYGEAWGQWGGAIRARRLYGFSGFAELVDEAASFVIAIKRGELLAESVLAKIPPERNPNLFPLLAACR